MGAYQSLSGYLPGSYILQSMQLSVLSKFVSLIFDKTFIVFFIASVEK